MFILSRSFTSPHHRAWYQDINWSDIKMAFHLGQKWDVS